MIARSFDGWQSWSWQRQLSGAIRHLDELLALLGLDPATAPPELAPALAASQSFPLRVSHSWLNRIRPGDWSDPLLRQVLPLATELDPWPGYSDDPLAERDSNPLPGLIHKYHGRVLLTVSSACAINCRYCFRRAFPYQDNRPGRDGWQAVLDYVARHPEIDEVILSGGDPLAANDATLASLARGLADLPSVRRLRLHTRLPIALPARIDDALLDWLTGTRLQPIVVVHSNHPRELDQEVAQALQRLGGAGVTLLNQSVLLRGVNDCVDTLARLSLALFDHGVLPYYLHVLDRVTGAGHFEVSELRARELWQRLGQRLPGFLLPRLAREDAGARAKTLLAPPSEAPEP